MHEKNVEIGYLLDFYGEIISPRRREVLDMYYNSDMSLAEISDELGITRQGVRDLIRKSGSELLMFEEKLGMARKFREIEACTDNLQKNPDNREAVIAAADRIREIINE